MISGDGTYISFRSNTLSATARSFIAVLISGFIVWTILSGSMTLRVPWWGFLFMLGVTYLVVDVALQAVQEKITGTH